MTRRRLGLSRGELVRRAGWRNVSKGANKLVRIERGEDVFPDDELRGRFARLLGITEDEMLAAMSEDFERLDRPAPPEVIVRVAAAVHVGLDLPEGCTVEEALEIAKRHAVEEKRHVCVVLSQLRCITIRPDGTSFESFGLPTTTLGGLPGKLLEERFRSKWGARLMKGVAGTVVERGKRQDP